MTTVASLVTAEELLRLPRGKARYELVRGELLTMSPAGSEHGAVALRLSTLLNQFVMARGIGMAFGAETGFLVQQNPDTVRAPDFAFVRRDRIPDGELPRGFWHGAPDLAVEVASPGDTLREIDEKVADWLAAGCVEVWVVNPHWKSVTVYASDASIKTYSGTDILTGGATLPGFECSVADFFAIRPR